MQLADSLVSKVNILGSEGNGNCSGGDGGGSGIVDVGGVGGSIRISRLVEPQVSRTW